MAISPTDTYFTSQALLTAESLHGPTEEEESSLHTAEQSLHSGSNNSY